MLTKNMKVSPYVTLLALMTLVGTSVSVTSPRSCVNLASSGLPRPTMSNRTLQNHVFLRTEVAGAYWCARRCLQQLRCHSLNFHIGSNTCQLSGASAHAHPNDVVPAQGFIYYNREDIPTYFLGACEGHDCHPEAICQPLDAANFTCKCQNLALGGNNCSAVYDTEACTDQPCGPYGTCIEDDLGHQCLCSPGFTGPKCDRIVCNDYNNRSISPLDWKPEVQVVWQNEAGTEVDIYWVPPSGPERLAVSVPAASDRAWRGSSQSLLVARDHDTQALLLVDGDCSFVVPQQISLPTITAA